jgi:hypothetical protein
MSACMSVGMSVCMRGELVARLYTSLTNSGHRSRGRGISPEEEGGGAEVVSTEVGGGAEVVSTEVGGRSRGGEYGGGGEEQRW